MSSCSLPQITHCTSSLNVRQTLSNLTKPVYEQVCPYLRLTKIKDYNHLSTKCLLKRAQNSTSVSGLED